MASLKSEKFTQPKMMPVDGRAVFFNDSYALAANPTAADTIDFHLPAGVEVNTLRFEFPDIDSNGTPTWAFKVGYRKARSDDTLAEVANYFALTGQTTGQSKGVLECQFAPIKFEVDVIIEITVEVACATFAAGTIYMKAGCNCIGPK